MALGLGAEWQAARHSLELALESAYLNLARARHIQITAHHWEIFQDRFIFPVDKTSEALDSTLVASTAEAGTTFTVRLPRRQDPGEELEAAA